MFRRGKHVGRGVEDSFSLLQSFQLKHLNLLELVESIEVHENQVHPLEGSITPSTLHPRLSS